MLLNRCYSLLPIFNESTLHYKPLISVRNYAARKGTRERKAKKKVKVEVQKVGFIPHNQRDKDKLSSKRPLRKFDDSHRITPVDNVYVARLYKWKVYGFSEAVQCHRETHHPDIYNKPNAELQIHIELNMQGEKNTRFIDNFTRMAPMPHKFNHGEERSIIAFTKEAEIQEEARAAGVSLAGGVELIKEIQNGSLSLQDFQFIIAHPNILPELVALRGLMKKKFPNPKNGTLDTDMSKMAYKFLNGLTYSAVKDEYEKDFGIIETAVGTLDMDPTHLEENFASLVQDVYLMKPKRQGTFISRCLMLCPPSREKFKLNHLAYLATEDENEEVSDDDDDDNEKVEISAG